MGAQVAALSVWMLWVTHTSVRTEQARVEPPHVLAATQADLPSSKTNRGRRPLRGDFPEYRPGNRASGRETFWR